MSIMGIKWEIEKCTMRKDIPPYKAHYFLPAFQKRSHGFLMHKKFKVCLIFIFIIKR